MFCTALFGIIHECLNSFEQSAEGEPGGSEKHTSGWKSGLGGQLALNLDGLCFQASGMALADHGRAYKVVLGTSKSGLRGSFGDFERILTAFRIIQELRDRRSSHS